MKYCIKCGASNIEHAKFCSECGSSIPNHTNSTDNLKQNTNINAQNKNAIFNQNEKRIFDNILELTRQTKYLKAIKAIFKVVLWIILFPVLLIRKVYKSKMNRILKNSLITILVFVGIIYYAFAVLISDVSNDVASEQNNSKYPNDNKNIEKPEKETVSKILIGDMADEKLVTNFIDACTEVNIEYINIKNMKKIEDWLSGPRYQFNYDGVTMMAYINVDNSVESINISDTQIYKQGFVSLNVSDYIIPSDMVVNIQLYAEKVIKTYLNYPLTAKFSFFGWGYERINDIYIVANSVKAKNAFGVEEEIQFYIEMKNDNNQLNTVYIVMDGVEIFGTKSDLLIEREEIISEAKEESEIIISEGQLGLYGKKVIINDNEFIHYYLPKGDYKVLSKTKNAMFYIAKNETVLNSDGYMESVNVTTVKFANVDESQTITIGADEHIFLVVNTKLILIRAN